MCGNPRKVAVLDDVIENNITFFPMTPVTAMTITTSEKKSKKRNVCPDLSSGAVLGPSSSETVPTKSKKGSSFR